MSGVDELAPDDEAEYKERREEIIQDAQETKEEAEEKQQEALEAIKEGSDLEEYETVELGELELEVKAWLPGGVEDTVLQAKKLGEGESAEEIKKSMETMLSALAEMTTDDTYNMSFWRKYYDSWGAEGLILAVETVLEPATESMEERKEGVESFRPSER